MDPIHLFDNDIPTYVLEDNPSKCVTRSIWEMKELKFFFVEVYVFSYFILVIKFSFLTRFYHTPFAFKSAIPVIHTNK